MKLTDLDREVFAEDEVDVVLSGIDEACNEAVLILGVRHRTLN